jgi:hypothetical protein
MLSPTALKIFAAVDDIAYNYLAMWATAVKTFTVSNVGDSDKKKSFNRTKTTFKQLLNVLGEVLCHLSGGFRSLISHLAPL